MAGEWVAELLVGRIQRTEPASLSRQLYTLLRAAMLDGRLPADTRLPSSRWLAKELGLARNTVLEVYEQLLAEGYLRARRGAGSFVEAGLLRAASAAPRRAPALSQRGQTLIDCGPTPLALDGAFAPGVPALSAFPRQRWQRALNRHLRHAPAHWLGYQAQGGLPALREALAAYLGQSRGVRCQPEQLLITGGAQQALDWLARLLADVGDVAWMEDPGYLGARSALTAAGLQLHPAPVDASGLDVAYAQAQLPAPRLIYVTPSHQYPGGAVMPLARRQALLACAEAHGAWIIEDDYDSEFRYASQPVAALQGLADSARVIYLGTLSKVMCPALRLAYLVVPESLIDAFRRASWHLAREGHYPTQAALADFISSGELARHIRRMRELYQSRQQALRQAVTQQLGAALPLSGGEAGMHVLAHLPADIDDVALARRGWLEQQLVLRPLSNHSLRTPAPRGWLLGYAGVEESAMAPAVARMARLLEGVW